MFATAHFSSAMVMALLPFLIGLTFIQRRKWGLGPISGIKAFASGKLLPTDMAECAVGAANIAVGDAVYLSAGKVLPASSQADAGTLAGNQEAFHDVFVGFAMEAATANQSALIAVATRGTMELDAASATFEIGDLIGLSENANGDALMPQKGVAVSTNANYALGRCVERKATADTKVRIAFVSTVMYGGPQSMM